jgi:hypothetical protein
MAEKRKASASVYPRAELMANAKAVFGVNSEVVEGALHGNTAPELTLDEVRAAINAFLQRKSN